MVIATKVVFPLMDILLGFGSDGNTGYRILDIPFSELKESPCWRLVGGKNVLLSYFRVGSDKVELVTSVPSWLPIRLGIPSLDKRKSEMILSCPCFSSSSGRR